MGKQTSKLCMIFAIGLCLSMVSGCYSARVSVGSEPTYRREAPPPPQGKPGPPPWAPAHGYRAKYQYRYYPSSYVYYDTGRNLYFCYANGKWEASVSLPSSIRIDVNDFITLEMDTQEPYRHHPDVVKRYPPGLQKTGPGKGKGKPN